MFADCDDCGDWLEWEPGRVWCPTCRRVYFPPELRQWSMPPDEPEEMS